MNANKILLIGPFVACCLGFASGAELVTDEPTRLKVLATVFPGMSITATPEKQIDDSRKWPAGPVTLDFPDALRGELVYRITGGACDRKREVCCG